MNRQTIELLNNVNKQFYSQVGKEFHQTRHKPWSGWQNYLQLINDKFAHKNQITVLDVGCGNGRFGEYLNSNLSQLQLNFTGIDADGFLLSQAKVALSSTKARLVEADILDLNFSVTDEFDVVAMFGVIHHVPSFQLRTELLKYLSTFLSHDGLLLVSCWQVNQLRNYQSKLVKAESVPNLDINQLEDNDYFLTWNKHGSLIRFCHQVTMKELRLLARVCSLNIQDSWYDDGSNLYAVLKKA